jgi:hypothetical protein
LDMQWPLGILIGAIRIHRFKKCGNKHSYSPIEMH